MDILSRIENKANSITASERKNENLYEMELDYLKKVISEKQAELRMLENLEAGYLDENTDKGYLQAELNNYLSVNERHYLHAKVLAAFTESFPRGAVDSVKVDALYGKMVSGPYRLERIGEVYKFTLPHLISKYTAFKSISDGQAISKLVSYLIKQYEQKTKLKVPVMEKAVIAFIHYVGKNQIPDPDNLDVKAVIDSLKGKMIVEDDVLRVSLYHEGILSKDLYTEVYVIEKKDIENGHFPVALFGLF